MARRNGRQNARGEWRCGRCGEHFPWSRENLEHFRKRTDWDTPWSLCRSCDREARRIAMAKRALADPAWYAARLEAWHASTARRNRQRQRARDRERAEWRETALAAYDWLLSRGLRQREINELAGLHEETVRVWRRGRGAWYRDSINRLLRVRVMASDLPAWEGRRSWQHARVHPAMDLLRARLEAE